MKDVHREKADLGNRAIDRPVRETAFFLQAVQEPYDIGIPNFGRLYVKSIGDKVQIGSNVGAVRSHGVVSQATKGNHLFIVF